MVLKMRMKSKFALCQPGYYRLLTENKKENHAFEVPIF